MFLGKCSKWNLDFENWPKSLCLGVSKPTKELDAKNTAYALFNWQGKQAFAKGNEKKKKSKSVKFLRCIDDFFPDDFLITSHYFKVASYV